LLRDCEKKSYKEKCEKKHRQIRYILYVRESVFVQPIAMKDCTFVKVTNAINLADFGGCMSKGLVSA
jgi:hypothetical protein